MADGRGEMCGRLLSDLGADVIRVEPPGGAASRTQAPLHDGVSLPFATHNAGKRGVVIDHTIADGRERLLRLLDDADIWIETRAPLDTDVVRARNPGLVVLSITDFGLTGPYRDWVATDWTLLAMGGVLSRSGLPGREPLMPPGDMALQVTAMQATWAALVAYWNRLECGRGDHIDFSLYEATAQAIDPAMGTVGTAQVAGYAETRDRPAPGPYPIFRCRDGHVRVVLLAPRQWHAMRAWLGEPEDLQDPELETIRGRALALRPAPCGLRAALPRARQARADARGPGARGADRARPDARRRARGRALPCPRRHRAHRARARDHGRRADGLRRDRRLPRAVRSPGAGARRARRRAVRRAGARAPT